MIPSRRIIFFSAIGRKLAGTRGILAIGCESKWQHAASTAPFHPPAPKAKSSGRSIQPDPLPCATQQSSTASSSKPPARSQSGSGTRFPPQVCWMPRSRWKTSPATSRARWKTSGNWYRAGNKRREPGDRGRDRRARLLPGEPNRSAPKPCRLANCGGRVSTGRGWAAQMIRYLQPELFGGNRAPRGHVRLHLLRRDERANPGDKLGLSGAGRNRKRQFAGATEVVNHTRPAR